MLDLIMRCNQCDLSYAGEPKRIVAGCREYVRMVFQLCPDWLKLGNVVANFKHGDGEAVGVDLVDGVCMVPWEAIEAPGFTVALIGYDSNGVRIVSDAVAFAVARGDAEPGEGSGEAPLTVYELCLQAAEEAKAANFSHSWNGSVLTISSTSGTSSMNLAGPQGPQGVPGPAGERGEDGSGGPSMVQTFRSIEGVGDSLMAGYVKTANNKLVDSADAVQTGLNWLSMMCRRNGIECANRAVGGSTAKSWRDGLLSIVGEADAYVVALGVNDSRNGLALGTSADCVAAYMSAPNTFYGNYWCLVRCLLADHPSARVLCLTAPTEAAAYNEAVRYVAGAVEGAVLVDLESDYANKFAAVAGQFVNGHYTTPAYAYISSVVEDAINATMLANMDKLTCAPCFPQGEAPEPALYAIESGQWTSTDRQGIVLETSGGNRIKITNNTGSPIDSCVVNLSNPGLFATNTRGDVVNNVPTELFSIAKGSFVESKVRVIDNPSNTSAAFGWRITNTSQSFSEISVTDTRTYKRIAVTTSQAASISCGLLYIDGINTPGDSIELELSCSIDGVRYI